jgi:murein L,D-transpeptidase YcbB/YkuD
MVIARRNSRNSIMRHSAASVAFLLVLACTSAVRAESVQYQRLQDALSRYEQMAIAGGWPAIPEGPTIEPGSADSRVAAVARRLVASGDLSASIPQLDTYDDQMRSAVLRFQERHGLEPDALIGKHTLGALNVPVEKRIAQIRINLERTRQVFAAQRDDFLLVNVPAFTVTLFREGEARVMTRVIVGETDKQTPLFEAPLKHVVLNPTWTVPRKIASEELLPRIRADVGFLTRNGYDVIDRDGSAVNPSDIEWTSLHKNNFPYTLVQRPGPLNELGRIKFIFPNDYGVCMHDTPKKFLFARDLRAFSHGCVRMEDPVEFAGHLLGPEGWTSERVAAQLETNKTQTIVLAKPLPVVLVYLTAEADDNGTVYFYRDIYDRDTS